MDRFNALSRGTQLMLVGAALLLVDTFLPWQRVEFDVLGVSGSESATAWNGFWGVMLGLLTIALLAWLVVRLLGTEVRLPVSDALVGAALASLILLFAVIKILTDDFVGYGAWIGLVLAILIAVGAWLQVQAAGGVDALRSDVSAVRSSAGGSASEPAAPPRGGPADEPAAPSTPRPPAPAAPPSPAAPGPPPATPPTPSEGTAPATEQPPASTQPPPRETGPSEDEPRQ